MKNNFNRSESAHSEDTLSKQKQAAIQFLELVASGKVYSAYEEYVDMDGKHHNAYFRAGFPALREAMKENAAQFPDKQLTVKYVLGDGDMVATYSHIVMRPGEKGMAVVHMFRFRESKIVEFWDCGQPVPEDLPNEDGMF